MSQQPKSPIDDDKTKPQFAKSSGRKSRTAAAGREFFRALGADLAQLAYRLGDLMQRRRSPSAPRPPRANRLFRTFLRGTAIVAILGVLTTLAAAVAMLWVLRDVPVDYGIASANDREILLEASDGAPLGRVGPLKISNASREEFPHHVVMAVLSIEDRRFYQHWGVDPRGIMRAMRRNYAAGTLVEGGSTITQQFVKRGLGNDRTFARKLREALLAIWLEMRLTKDQILTRYLNTVYLGAGAQGLPAAAKLYFDKEPSDLTLAEAALLAGLIKAPSRLNPLQNLKAARERAEIVLDAMVGSGAIDRRAAEDAKSHPAVVSSPVIESEAGTWFADWVAAEARDMTGTFSGTTRVRTTFAPQLQQLAQQVLNDALAENANRNVSQGALVAMRPDGAVVAMVGGRDYKQSQFNRAVQAQRQPGSAFKLFVYLAALRSGLRLEDRIEDAPLEINGWRPENFGGRYAGTVTLADAFARSINTVAVRLALKVGIDEVIAASRDLGINSPLPRVPSVALGSGEVTLLNLTAAYAAVLAGRSPVQPWGVASFASPTRPRLVSTGPPSGLQQPLGYVREPLMALLKRAVEQGTARKAALEGLAAGKTGTTQDYRDAWFICFNESLVVGVWVGNDDRAPMDEVTGGSLPAVIWKNFMTKAASVMVSEAQRAAEPAPAQKDVAMSEAATAQGPGQPTLRQQQDQCDYRACAATYQSFNPADCSYQPYGGGQRARCEKLPQPARRGSGSREMVAASEPASGQCNVAACAATYSSFRGSDCSYQPFDGGARRVCNK